MGTVPTITVGTIITIATITLQILASTTGFVPPDNVRQFFDENGVAVAGVLAALITSAITYFRVFSPDSVAKKVSGLEVTNTGDGRVLGTGSEPA